MRFIKTMKTKALAVFTVLCMLAGSAGMYVRAETCGNTAEEPTYSVNFGEGAWTVNDIQVTADKTGTLNITGTEIITLVNFDPETMEAKVVAVDGFTVELAVTEGKTSLSARMHEGAYPDGKLTFRIEAKQSDSQEGGDPVQPPKTDSSTTVTLSGNIAFRINDSDFVGHENVETKDHTVRYNKKIDNNGNTTDAVDITIS